MLVKIIQSNECITAHLVHCNQINFMHTFEIEDDFKRLAWGLGITCPGGTSTAWAIYTFLFYWSLLLQPQDQIEFGEDSFKQWDGKSGFRCGKRNSNVFPPFHNHSDVCIIVTQT